MTDQLRTDTSDSERLRAESVGVVCGCLVVWFRGMLHRSIGEQPIALLQIAVVLGLAAAAGIAAVMIHPAGLKSARRAFGMGGRLGIRAGLRSALVAGALLTGLATVEALAASNAAMESALRQRLWPTLFVSLAALLPGVLCGFLGGTLGARLVASRIPAHSADHAGTRLPWLQGCSSAMSAGCVIGLLLPLSFLGRPPRADFPPLPSNAESPPFHYQAPAELMTAKLGEIQPAFTKTLEGVAGDAAMSLSPDGKWFAFCDHSRSGKSITVVDLERFQPVASWAVPAFPRSCLSWSPDMTRLACTIQGQEGQKRLWILGVSGRQAVELPRPSNRDTPAGDVFWWHEKEVVFFPEDEPALALDLEKLTLCPAQESTFLKTAGESARRRWMNGPHGVIPETAEWRFDLATVLTRSEPPPRREPSAPWQLSATTFCSLAHPGKAVAHGFPALPVHAGMRIFCAPDASKIIRIDNGRAEVTFMKVAEAPGCQVEAAMPASAGEARDEAFKQQVRSNELCAFVYAPLVNPLSGKTVGPDFGHLKALVRLLEWKDRKAVFFTTTWVEPIAPADVISTLHVWRAETMLPCQEGAPDWWAPVKDLAGRSFDALPSRSTLPPIDAPMSLALVPNGSALVVTKAAPRPAPPPPRPAPLSLVPQPLSSDAVPMVAHETQDADVRSFLEQHHLKASAGDVDGMAADYHDSVDFLDKGRLTQGDIRAEEFKQRRRWPKSHESILGGIVLDREGTTWVATYTLQFRNETDAGDWLLGKADLTVRVMAKSSGLCITDQKARVYDVRSRAGSGR